jgi:hypothetical protein
MVTAKSTSVATVAIAVLDSTTLVAKSIATLFTPDTAEISETAVPNCVAADMASVNWANSTVEALISYKLDTASTAAALSLINGTNVAMEEALSSAVTVSEILLTNVALARTLSSAVALSWTAVINVALADTVSLIWLLSVNAAGNSTRLAVVSLA